MKNNFLFKMMLLAVAASLSLVACEEKMPEANVVFPEEISQALEADGSYTMEVTADMDWTAELKYDSKSAGWFWIQDGNSKVYSARGKAGETVPVMVCAGSLTDFDEHSCTIEMKMGGKTQVIATFTRAPKDRVLSLAYCQLDDLGDDYLGSSSSNGLKYEYNETLTDFEEAIPLQWIARIGGFARSILVSANFEWQLKSKPEWLQSFSGAAAGETVEVNMLGESEFYTLEDAVEDLVLCAVSNQEATFTYKVMMPGCKNRVNISGFEDVTSANGSGKIYDENAAGSDDVEADEADKFLDAEVGMTGNIVSAKAVTPVFFVYDDTKGWEKLAVGTEWLTVTLGEWDDQGSVFQERSLNLKVAANTTSKVRKAAVLIVPDGMIPSDASEYLLDKDTFAEEFAGYLMTIVLQSEMGNNEIVVENPITFIMESQYGKTIEPDVATLEMVTEDNLQELMTKYQKYDNLNISDYSTSTTFTYILTYYSTSQSMTQLSIPGFDPDEALMFTVNPKGEWLTYEQSENALSIWMSKPGADASQNFGIVQIYLKGNKSYTIICLPELP